MEKLRFPDRFHAVHFFLSQDHGWTAWPSVPAMPRLPASTGLLGRLEPATSTPVGPPGCRRAPEGALREDGVAPPAFSPGAARQASLRSGVVPPAAAVGATSRGARPRPVRPTRRAVRSPLSVARIGHPLTRGPGGAAPEWSAPERGAGGRAL